MASPGQEVGKDASSAADERTMQELRASVSSIADDLKKVVAARTETAREQAQDAVAAARKGIRKQPAIAMGVAAATGAVLAVLLVPRFGRRPSSRWQAWVRSVPNVTRADLYDFANDVQHSAMRAANSVPLTASLERLVDAVSKVEPSASLTSAIEKAGTWIQKMRSGAKG